MRRNLLLLLLWLAGLLAVDAQTLSRKEVETYVINQYGQRWKDIALYLGEKDTLDKDNALTFEKTISVRGKSKNELFVDLNYWFLKTFSNANSSIEMADKELGLSWQRVICQALLITREVIPLIVSIFVLLCVATSKMNRSN